MVQKLLTFIFFQHLSTAEYFLYNTMATRVTADEEPEQLTYGALVKNLHDFEFLKDFARDARFRERTRIWNLWNLHNENILSSHGGKFTTIGKKWNLYSGKQALLFSIEDDYNYFLKTVYSILGTIGIMFLVGLMFELRRTKCQLRKMFEMDEKNSSEDVLPDKLLESS